MADICYGGGTHGFKAFIFAELLNWTVLYAHKTFHAIPPVHKPIIFHKTHLGF